MALLLGGCAGPMGRASSYSPTMETGPWVDLKPSVDERLFAASDISFEVIRFTDSRGEPLYQDISRDKSIYVYNPDQLLQGVSTRIPMLLEKYIAYKAKRPKHYLVEVDLRKLSTTIRTGTLWSGSGGRYGVTLEIAALVRRSDSSVALQRHYRAAYTEARRSSNGRGPTEEEDYRAMNNLIERAMRDVAVNLTKDIRYGDARRWEITATEAEPLPEPFQPTIIPAHVNFPE